MTTSTLETRSSWIVASVSVALLSLSFGALWITAVGLKSIAADLGGARSAPSLANSLAWFGSSIGGIAMGRLADRFGIRWTVMFGAVSICIGLFISTLGEPWQRYVGDRRIRGNGERMVGAVQRYQRPQNRSQGPGQGQGAQGGNPTDAPPAGGGTPTGGASGAGTPAATLPF